MSFKKRGLGVLVVLLLFLPSFVIANLEKYGQMNGDVDMSGDVRGYCSERRPDETLSSPDADSPDTPSSGCEFYGDVYFGSCAKIISACGHETGSRYFSEGNMFYPYYSYVDTPLITTEPAGAGRVFGEQCDQNIALQAARWKTPDASSYICGPYSWWYKCSADVAKASLWLTLSGSVFYANCTESEGVYLWQIFGVDNDLDGFISGDSSDGAYVRECSTETSPLENCFDLTRDELQGKTLNDAQQYVKDICRSNPSYGRCPACQNFGTPEICGDDVDNDCNPETPDNCNFNKAGCENTDPTTATNIFNEKFSWIDTAERGYCCGYSGITDLGIERVEPLSSGHYLCLNKNPLLVGREADIPGWPPAGAESTPRCEGNWCWVNAVGASRFKVMTIKKPGEQPYDVVSDSRQWQKCDGTQPVKEGSLFSRYTGILPDEAYKANHFYCYREGQHYGWAEH